MTVNNAPLVARRHSATALGVFLCAAAGLLASCKDPVGVVEAAPAAIETAVGVSSAPRSAAAPGYMIDAMTIETRRWISADWVTTIDNHAYWTVRPAPTGLAAVSAFEALPRTVAGYTNAPVELPSLQCSNITPGAIGTPPDYLDGYATHYQGCIRNPGDGSTASNSDIGVRYRARITATKTINVAVRFAVDFVGGVLLVDGQVVAQNWDDPFWNGYFDTDNGNFGPDGVTYIPRWETDVSTVLTHSFRMSANTTHTIEVVGFENGSDYGSSAQINDGGGWANAVSKVPAYTVPVSVNIGTGGGKVTSAPAGINCGVTCSFNFAWATMPSLTAIPAQYFAFNGWSGDCTGMDWCAPLVETPKTVTAAFVRVQWPLQVTLAGTGGGGVSSSDGVISCGSGGTPVCLAGFPVGGTVTLTALPNAKSDFAGWTTGSCPGTSSCTVTMNQAQNVTATFTLKKYSLSVSKAGNGAGTVTSSPAGITNCSTTCSASFDIDTPVTLTATPGVSSDFAGWSMASCPGLGPCTVTMSQAQSVTATFTLKRFELTIAKAGDGAGTVTSTPGSINCGPTCISTYDAGASVTLTASAAPDSKFAGWSACTGTGTCTVEMSLAKAVTATFTLKPTGDVDPPVLSCQANPPVLWSVNHKLVAIKVTVTLTDAGSGPDGFKLLSVTSNEPVNAAGDGSTSPDIVGWNLGDGTTGQLRAERAGTLRDRVYTLNYRGWDKAGLYTDASCTVTVPHDQK